MAAAKSCDVSFLILVSASAASPANQMMFDAKQNLKESGYTDDVISLALDLKNMEDDYYRAVIDRDSAENRLQQFMQESWYEKAFLPEGGLLPADVTKEKWFQELDFNPLACFSKVTVPTLFILGDQDIYVDIEHSIIEYTKTTKSNPAASIIKMEGLDHFMIKSPLQSTDTREIPQSVSKEYLTIMTNWLQSILTHSSKN